jgi:hypothetical protein
MRGLFDEREVLRKGELAAAQDGDLPFFAVFHVDAP